MQHTEKEREITPDEKVLVAALLDWCAGFMWRI